MPSSTSNGNIAYFSICTYLFWISGLFTDFHVKAMQCWKFHLKASKSVNQLMTKIWYANNDVTCDNWEKKLWQNVSIEQIILGSNVISDLNIFLFSRAILPLGTFYPNLVQLAAQLHTHPVSLHSKEEVINVCGFHQTTLELLILKAVLECSHLPFSILLSFLLVFLLQNYEDRGLRALFVQICGSWGGTLPVRSWWVVGVSPWWRIYCALAQANSCTSCEVLDNTL